ncbi:MAG: WecB/TagA/CpsF family glycosyltransferase [Armatimonadota bacterium]
MAKSVKTSAGCILGGLAAAAIVVGGAVAVRRWRRMPVAERRLELLDVPVDPLTMEEVLTRIEAFIRTREPHHVFTADASGIMRAQEEPELLEIVRRADLVTPDGAGVLLATRMKGMRLPERVSGVDLVDRISEMASRKGFRIYLLGASEMVVQAAAGVLASRYPGLIIAGIHDGYFKPEDEPRVVRDIAVARPDVLFVALGIPKQEQFIRKHFTDLGVPVMIGVGGSYDVISGQLKRAPAWMQQSGLEWLYRFLQQPSRLPRLAALPKFMLAAWKTRK